MNTDGVPAVATARCFATGEDLVALRLREDGRLVSDLARPGQHSRNPRKIGHWVAAPMRGGGRKVTRDASRETATPAPARAAPGARKLSGSDGVVLGWLRTTDSPGCSPLIERNPSVTGDELAACSAHEALNHGYVLDGVLGYVLNAGANSAR